MYSFSDSTYKKALDQVKPLKQIIEDNNLNIEKSDRYFLMEMILWGLAEHNKLNKESLIGGFNFADLFSSYLRGGEI